MESSAIEARCFSAQRHPRHLDGPRLWLCAYIAAPDGCGLRAREGRSKGAAAVRFPQTRSRKKLADSPQFTVVARAVIPVEREPCSRGGSESWTRSLTTDEKKPQR